MNIFQLVKSQITTRQAAEHYGLNVQRNGMTLCPFHDDHAPSLKVDTRFYCFGCQVKGDVIDFVSKLFGLSLIQAAQKLAADFGLDPNTPQSAAVVPAQPPVVQQRRLVLECTKALTDYERLLNHWKTAYAPADMNAPWDGRFAQALHELPAIGHVLDLLYSADAKLREDTAKALVEDNRLSAKEIIGNKAKLSQWQSDYWTHMVGKYPDLERGESADKTDRKHIPPRVFKEMTHLAKQSRKIEAVMDDANVFNAKGKLQEVEALLERFIPSVERMQTQLDQYKVAFTDTTTENASLKKEVAELQSKLDTAKRGSVQKKLDDAQLLNDYRELRRIVERIPPEILERAKRQERSTAASRCTR